MEFTGKGAERGRDGGRGGGGREPAFLLTPRFEI